MWHSLEIKVRSKKFPDTRSKSKQTISGSDTKLQNNHHMTNKKCPNTKSTIEHDSYSDDSWLAEKNLSFSNLWLIQIKSVHTQKVVSLMWQRQSVANKHFLLKLVLVQFLFCQIHLYIFFFILELDSHTMVQAHFLNIWWDGMVLWDQLFVCVLHIVLSRLNWKISQNKWLYLVLLWILTGSFILLCPGLIFLMIICKYLEHSGVSAA